MAKDGSRVSSRVKRVVKMVIGCVMLFWLLPLAAGQAEQADEIAALKAQIKELQERLEAVEEQQKWAGDVVEDLQKEQTAETGTAPWMLTGFMTASFVDEASDADNPDSSFRFDNFSPIFLYSLGDRVLFEGELEIEREEDTGETELDIEYAQVNILLHDYVQVVGGRFLTPFSLFEERLHPTWINKMPTTPVAFAHHGGFLPLTETGAQIRGNLPLPIVAGSKINYALGVANGPRLIDSGHDAGDLDFSANTRDNNTNKAFVGRFGLIPVPYTELGVSYYRGKYDDDDDRRVGIFGVDFSFTYKDFDLRFEWARSRQEVDEALIDALEASGNVPPMVIMELEEALETEGRIWERRGWYIQAAYKLTDVPFPFFGEYLTNLEPVIRFSEVDVPGKELAGGRDQYVTSFGFNYVASPSLVFKAAYEWKHRQKDNISDNAFQFQAAYGF